MEEAIDRRPLVFLHNIRSAGNMVAETLRQRMAAEGCLERIFHVGGNTRTTLDDMFAQNAKSPFWIVTGHNVFGVHERMNTDVRYFTNIRDTVDRLRSSAGAYDDSGEAERYIAENWEFDNGITKRLAGISRVCGRAVRIADGADLGPADTFRVDDEVYESARENLSRIPVAIIQERLPESLIVFERTFGLPPIFNFVYHRHNRAPRRISLDSGFVGELRALNAYDSEIIAHYQDNLDGMLDELGESAHRAVRARAAMFEAVEPATDVMQALAAVQELANRNFQAGENDLAYEVLSVLIGDVCIDRAVRGQFVDAIRQGPESPVRDSAIRSFESSVTVKAAFGMA